MILMVIFENDLLNLFSIIVAILIPMLIDKFFFAKDPMGTEEYLKSRNPGKKIGLTKNDIVTFRIPILDKNMTYKGIVLKFYIIIPLISQI